MKTERRIQSLMRQTLAESRILMLVGTISDSSFRSRHDFYLRFLYSIQLIVSRLIGFRSVAKGFRIPFRCLRPVLFDARVDLCAPWLVAVLQVSFASQAYLSLRRECSLCLQRTEKINIL